MSLRLQKRLAASVMRVGERKVWLDPNEVARIGQSNSRKNVRNDEGLWTGVETYLQEHTKLSFTHGLCPDCRQKHFGEIKEP